MDLEVTIEISFNDDESIDINLIGGDMGVLIGKRGQTLDSLQYLISLVANKEVKRTRRPVSLEPMNPYERRIIHSALQNDKYVSTKSEGEEPFRHVVVFMKKQ